MMELVDEMRADLALVSARLHAEHNPLWPTEQIYGFSFANSRCGNHDSWPLLQIFAAMRCVQARYFLKSRGGCVFRKAAKHHPL